MASLIDFANATAGTFPRGEKHGAPLVGISANVDGETSRLHRDYMQAVLDAGGVPVIVPATDDMGALREIVERLDALVLSGGADIAGEYFGEPTLDGLTEVDPFRDRYELLLLRLATDRQLPIFGICRGMQLLNVAFGGTLWQDIPSQYTGTPLPHSVIIPEKERPAHTVSLVPGTRIASALGTRETGVNSRHHQGVRDLAPGFRVAATAPDGIIEAIEAFPVRRIWGVQWHPENMAVAGDGGMRGLFRLLIEEATLFRRAKSIHEGTLAVDSHCDTPMIFAEHDMDFGRRDNICRTSLPKMAEGRMSGEFVAAYLPQGPLDAQSEAAAVEKAVGLLDAMWRQVEANAAYAGIARTFAEADELKRQGRKAIFLAVENGYAIGRDLSNLSRLHERGVVYMTLCHNGANALCDSASGEAMHGGLSELGREAVREMNRLGMVIDLSHAAESTFHDVLRESRVPVIASHSSARALTDHPRNLTDDQLRALAAAGGVAQVCLYTYFLCKDHEATLQDAADHIDHVVRVAGIDAVGIGSDFDGGGGIAGCDASNELINLTVELLRRGYTDGDMGKILGGNLRRAVDAVQSGHEL